MQQQNDIDWVELRWCLCRGGFTLEEYLEYKRSTNKPLPFTSRQGLHHALVSHFAPKDLASLRRAGWHARRVGLSRYVSKAVLLKDIRVCGGKFPLARMLAQGEIPFSGKSGGLSNRPQCKIKRMENSAQNYYLWIVNQLKRFDGIYKRSGTKIK